VLVMAYGTTALAGLSVSAAAFAGAAAVLVAVFAFAQTSGTFTDSRLVLAGVAVGYVTTAVTSFVQLEARPDQVSGILFWTLGSVAAARWSNILLPSAVTVLCGGWLLTRGRGLNALSLGDDDATAVGVDIRTFRLGLLVVAALLTAVSVSNAGGVGFVGLIVPQTVRLVVGGDHRRLLPLSAVAGALLLVCVDLVARTVAAPAELPLTIFTSLVGGPLFLVTMRRNPAARAVAR
jgi:iron complex transport system permease protein